ncbi:MAG: 4Fe-4S dicluster domain-containing protein [Terracidiphilus sp.]|jgi:ferredoxin
MARVVDVNLLRKIKRHGAGGTLDVSACFNCGNCTAVCPLAQESTGFPRRMIRMAQVGMERELLASEDLWRCYACGECTETCPREADPAEFMAAARSYAIARYDFTGLAGLASRSAYGNLLVFAVFSAFFSLLLMVRESAAVEQLPLFDFLPGEWIHDIGVALFAVVGLSAALGVALMFVRFWMERRREGLTPRVTALPGAIAAAISDALLHRRFRECDSAEEISERPIEPLHRRTWFIHAMVMGGFLAMLLATTLDFLLKSIGSPAPPWYPMRLLGAIGGIVCLYGLAIALNRRMRAAEVPWRKSAFSDWFFPVLLAATVLTGLFTEIVVYLPMNTVGHTVFFVHVVLAMDLVAMLPLTKFAHAFYRTLALVLFAWRHAPAPEAVVADAHS